jgi:hypothetical protein
MTSSARARIERGDRQAERFSGLEVDDQLECGWLLHRQIGRLGAVEDFSGVNAGLVKNSRQNDPGPLRCYRGCAPAAGAETWPTIIGGLSIAYAAMPINKRAGITIGGTRYFIVPPISALLGWLG